MSKIQYEHPFLESALKRAVVSITHVVGGSVALMIAWSPRNLLLERPEYAALSRPTVAFLQLPQSYQSLVESIAAIGSTEDPEVELLSKPLGQLQWAIGALEKTVESEGADRALSRLKYLQRFVNNHWPGWYDPVIVKIRQRIEDHSRITELARASLSLSGQIAAVEACGPLMAWTNEENRRDRLTTSLEALCYASQELLAADKVSDYLYRDPWWTDLNVDLAGAVTALDEIGDQEPAQKTVKASLALIGEQLNFFNQMLTPPELGPSQEPTPSEIRTLLEKLEQLVESLLGLARFRNSTRSMLLAQLAEDQR